MKIFTIGKADVPDCDERLKIPANPRTFLLSIVDPSDKPPRRPVNIPPNNHKVIHFHDLDDHAVNDPTFNKSGISLNQVPQTFHLKDLIAWFQEIENEADILIVHCFAGISRSTAMTFVFHCLLRGIGNEKAALDDMVQSVVFGGARPNQRIVRLADALLERKGRMIQVMKEYYVQIDTRRKLEAKFGDIDHLFIK
jgi:predicted protein tyrosine phosphatase